jgi:uncharacterized protein (DUF1778 family)
MDRPKRDALLKARCQDRELEVVKAAARLESLSISEFARTAALERARRVLIGAHAEAAS